MISMLLAAAAVLIVAVSCAIFLPRFSRAVLGPAVIVVTIWLCRKILIQAETQSDAWGPGAGVIVLVLGGAGLVAGLILIVFGVEGRTPARSSARPVESPPRPYQLPGPGIFTPTRLLILSIVFPAALAVVLFNFF
jgi:hypothetical protein